MRLVVQRVSGASVAWRDDLSGEERVNRIGRGLAVLCGAGPEDDEAAVRRLAQRVANLRIFPAEAPSPGGEVHRQSGFDQSLLDVGGEALVVSQFTLYADTRRGRRPGFSSGADPERARVLYLEFAAELERSGVTVRTGSFGAAMSLELANEGPVTLVVSTAPWETAI